MVQAYGREEQEVKNYSKYLKTQSCQRNNLVSRSVAFAMIFLTIYMFYGYSLFSGGLLKWNSVVENDVKFTGGTIVTIMFCVMLGAFGIGNTQSVLKII